MTHLTSNVILSAAVGPSQDFIHFLTTNASEEPEIVQTLCANVPMLLESEAGLDNLCVLVLRVTPEHQAALIQEILPQLPTLLYDPVGYQLMGACLFSNVPDSMKIQLEKVLTEHLPRLLHHEIGVYVVRDLALRGVALVTDAIAKEMESLLATPLGCELLSWLVDVPTVGSYVSTNWDRLSGSPTALRVVLAALRVRAHLQHIFEDVLPEFITNCSTPRIRAVINEMIPLLDIPAMQGLCDKLMSFPGRGSSRLIDLFGAEGGYEIGMQILDAAEGVTRVLLVDHLRTFAIYLKGLPHEADITKWATDNPNFNEVIVVYDKATSQFYTMDIAYTSSTFNRREWLRLRGKVDHLASVCINFQNDTCRAHERCNMIHVDREIIKSLRPRSCCAEHGHEQSSALGDSGRMMKVVLGNQQEIDVPSKHFARTAGWDTLKGTTILECNICRQHQREACGKPMTCKFIHICREVWGHVSMPPVPAGPKVHVQLPPAHPPNMMSFPRIIPPPPNGMFHPAASMLVLKNMHMPPPEVFAPPMAQPFFVPFAPYPAVFLQQPPAFVDDQQQNNPHYFAAAAPPMNMEHAYPHAQQGGYQADSGTLIRRKKYIQGGTS